MATDPTMQSGMAGATEGAVGSTFQTLGVVQATGSLEELLRKVTHDCGRVQIVGRDDGRNGVLISKAELDSLEEALAILSATPGAEVMRDEVIAVAASTMGDTLKAEPAMSQS